MTAAAKRTAGLGQAGGCCRVTAAAGDISVPMVRVHRLPGLGLAFMTERT